MEAENTRLRKNFGIELEKQRQRLEVYFSSCSTIDIAFLKNHNASIIS